MRSWQRGARASGSPPVMVEQRPQCMVEHHGHVHTSTSAQVIISVIHTSVSGHAGNEPGISIPNCRREAIRPTSGTSRKWLFHACQPNSPAPVFPRLCSSARTTRHITIKANALRSLANDFEKRFDTLPASCRLFPRNIEWWTGLKPSSATDTRALQSRCGDAGIRLFHASLRVIVSV